MATNFEIGGLMRAGRYAHRLALAVIVVVVLHSLLPLPESVSASSHYTPHSPIYIDGNANFTAANGVTGGTGTPLDPYIIHGWDIDASSVNGIVIRNTDVHFAIRDVYVHSGENHLGISLKNVVNGEVGNVTSIENVDGIRIDSSRDIRVIGNNVSGNRISGIRLHSSRNVNITGNALSDNFRGILLVASKNVRITDNVGSDFISIEPDIVPSTDVIVTDNNVSGVHLFDSTNITIARNTFASDGVRIWGWFVAHFNTHTITEDNLVNGRPLHYQKDCAGLNLDGIELGQLIVANCTDVLIANLSIADTDIGIEMAYVEGATVTGSDLEGNTYGIAVLKSTNATFTSNSVSSNLFGIYVWYSENTLVTGNDISSNDNGIYLRASTDTIVKGNRISSNHNGVGLTYATSANVWGNDISANANGIRLNKSNNILVHHNNIVNNKVQAYDDGGSENSWDGGYPNGGNYWSDYLGYDSCSGPTQDVCPDHDGIGDIPYTIDANSQDSYPLLEPYNTPPTASFTVDPSMGNVTTTFAVDASPSSDAENPMDALEVRWDWGGDGTWDTSWSTEKAATHQYAYAGTYGIRLEVRDMGGLVNQTMSYVEVADTEKPTIWITSPVDGTTLNSASVTVSGMASDNVAVEKVEIGTDGTKWVLATGSTSWSGTLTLAEGSNSIYARATDTSGNTATVSIAATVDTTPPGFQVSPSVAMFAGIGVVAVIAAVAALLILRSRGKRKGEG